MKYLLSCSEPSWVCTPTCAVLNIFKCSNTECLPKGKVVIYPQWLSNWSNTRLVYGTFRQVKRFCSMRCALESWFPSCWIVRQHLKLREVDVTAKKKKKAHIICKFWIVQYLQICVLSLVLAGRSEITSSLPFWFIACCLPVWHLEVRISGTI